MTAFCTKVTVGMCANYRRTLTHDLDNLSGYLHKVKHNERVTCNLYTNEQPILKKEIKKPFHYSEEVHMIMLSSFDSIQYTSHRCSLFNSSKFNY